MPGSPHSPIDILVDDILFQIFFLYVSTTFFERVNIIRDVADPLRTFNHILRRDEAILSPTLRLASVCKRWAMICNDSAILWAFIYLPWLSSYGDAAPPWLLQQIVTHIQNSGQTELRICLAFLDRLPRHNSLRRATDILWSHSFRWRSLDLFQPPFRNSVMATFAAPIAAPCLIIVTLTDSTICTWILATPSPLSACRTLLVKLHAFRIFPMTSQSFPSITHLRVRLYNRRGDRRWINPHGTYDNAISLMTYMPRLESVRFDFPSGPPIFHDVVQPPPTHFHFSTSIINLPFLRSFHLRGYAEGAESISPQLRRFRFPMVDNVRIDEPLPHTLPAFLSSYWNFRGLRIFHFTIPTNDVTFTLTWTMLDALVGVEELTISSYGHYRTLLLVRQLCDSSLIPSLRLLRLQRLQNVPSDLAPEGFDFAHNVVDLIEVRAGTLQRIEAHITARTEELDSLEQRILATSVYADLVIHCVGGGVRFFNSATGLDVYTAI